MQLEPRQRWRPWRGSVGIHRIGPRILTIALIVALLWIGAIMVTDWVRSGQVATWAGPDATVRSGYALGRCTFPASPADRMFPVWLRYDGRLYRFADLTLPVTDESIARGTYVPTGYSLDGLSLLTIEDTPAGQARERVMVRATGADGGVVYTVTAECE